MPALVIGGVWAVSVAVALVWALGPANPWMPLLYGALISPAALWVVDCLHGGVFDGKARRPPYARRLRATMIIVSFPATAATCALLAEMAAGATHLVLFEVLVLAGVLSTLFAVAVATVAIPLAAVRSEIRMRTVYGFAVYSTVRRPAGPAAALLSGLAVVWLGLTWNSGLLFLVLPLVVLVGTAAAWPAAAAAGVTLPPLLPRRRVANSMMGIEHDSRVARRDASEALGHR